MHRPSSQIATVVAEMLRALCVSVPVELWDIPAALAQTVEPSPLAADIPAQPLGQALAAFATQTGLQLVYVSEIAEHRRSHAVVAGLSARDALSRLLLGTGLRFEYLTPKSIRILAGASPQRGTKKMTAGDDPDEVIVTADRRQEKLRDVPIAIEVLTSATLARLNATTFDDFVRYLPGVTALGIGPAQNNIYMRGLATGDPGILGEGFSASFPSVAVYLDEQSAQLPGRNLDIYAADLDRVEVLEGPQGTLFGAGAQAGVLRYITNKPKLDVTEAALNAGYAATAHGDPSSALDAVINIPVIADKLAMRAVIYNERRGGYIDNIPATFARADTDPSIRYAGGAVPANSVVIDNSALVAKNINPVTYQGIRAGALYQINEDWSALLTQSYQSMRADGVFAEESINSLGQRQPELTVQLFNASYDKDRFENTALTIEGRVKALRLLYAGSYFVRNVEQLQDYTDYVRAGTYVDYYQCINPGPTPAAAQCFSPSSTRRDLERNTHLSHELRLSTPDDWRIRGVGGLFLENYRIHDQTDFFYLTAFPYFHPIAPPTDYYTLNGRPVCGCVPGAVLAPGGVTSNNPNVRPPSDGYFNDITRGYEQKAAYASIDLGLIPDTLTLTTGTRYFNTHATEVGAYVSSFGCQLINNPDAPNPCINRYFTNINSYKLDRTWSGFRSRVNLSWKVGEDALIYYTWSQGFRSGGLNRPGVGPSGESPLSPGPYSWQAQANLHGGWQPSLAFAPDSLINNEVGWKTNWWNQRLYWSGALYREEFNHAQVLASQVLGHVVVNGGTYRVHGVETSIVTRTATGLSIEVGAAWNHGALVKEGSFSWADGTPIDFGALQTSTGQKFPNPAGTRGSPLAGAPALQVNLRARYQIVFHGYDVFAQIGAVHQSHSLASSERSSVDLQGNSIAYDLPPFTTFDGALGYGKDAWLVQLYGENLSDKRAQLFANYSLFNKAITVNRPRTVGLRVSYKFRSTG